MGYEKAQDALPHHLLCAIQEYIERETFYIPKKESGKLPRGAKTQTRQTIRARNSTSSRVTVTVHPLLNGPDSISVLSKQYTKS